MGLLYVVWGSTYLAIRVTVETLHPLAAGGVRFLLAGAAHARRRWPRSAAWAQRPSRGASCAARR